MWIAPLPTTIDEILRQQLERKRLRLRDRNGEDFVIDRRGSPNG